MGRREGFKPTSHIELVRFLSLMVTGNRLSTYPNGPFFLAASRPPLLLCLSCPPGCSLPFVRCCSCMCALPLPCGCYGIGPSSPSFAYFRSTVGTRGACFMVPFPKEKYPPYISLAATSNVYTLHTFYGWHC